MMAERDQYLLGEGSAMLTPRDYKVRPIVEIGRCIKEVPPAAGSIIGTCSYYYRPLHGAYLETVEKVSVSSIWETVKAFATSWDPWTDKAVARRLLHRREKLIAPESTDSDWSRHGNFMMRHIGCGHKPPAYYISYGYYYCSSYGARLYPELSQEGKLWLARARRFLQINMEIGLAQNMQGDVIQFDSQKPGNGKVIMKIPQYDLELNSNKFKIFAFQTHPLAYLDAGLADFPFGDLMLIGRQPNIQEWTDVQTWNQATESGWKVMRGKMESMSLPDVVDPIEKALGRLLAK